MKAFYDAGVVVTSASDYPVTIPPRPLDAMQFGAIRQAAGMLENLLGEEERVTIAQMIEATTINAAFQLKRDDRLGSIAMGKQADIVLLDRDITACDPEPSPTPRCWAPWSTARSSTSAPTRRPPWPPALKSRCSSSSCTPAPSGPAPCASADSPREA